MTPDQRQRIVSSINWLLANLRPYPPDHELSGWTPIELEAYEQNKRACNEVLLEISAGLSDAMELSAYVADPRELAGGFVEIVPRDADESVPMASVSTRTVVEPEPAPIVVPAAVETKETQAVRAACENCFEPGHTIDFCKWTQP